MPNVQAMRRTVFAFAIVVLTVFVPGLDGIGSGGFAGPAYAQEPPTTLDPGTSQPAQPAPPPPEPAPQPAQEPIILQVPVPPRNGEAVPAAEDDSAFYYSEDDDGDPRRRFFGDRRGGNTIFGPVPPIHVIRRGDTLWDICWFYFNNPYEWPKIWSYNPTITNPHWIYPGDLVRLYPQGLNSVTIPEIDPEVAPEAADIQPTPARSYNVSLRQVAFVDREKLNIAAIIVGSVEEKTLLSLGDAVYLDYRGNPPKVGKRYTIYTESQTVTHPYNKRIVGAYVRLLGELEVVSVKKGKRARAVITDSLDVIERGARVGPLQRTFRTVEPRRNKVDVQGTVVAMLGSEQLIGQGQLIFIDKGKGDGIEVGNRMFVVRRGDALEEIMKPSSNVGKDDRRFPARAVGEIIVVQVGKNASIALVTLALRAIGVGDLVLMRKSR
ncbi:MAG: LysM peptidoglycan-binding domain-containing protein [Proteobacteria bacterium]|nr:LysM peptidoglycan-binding domain-containing protein [Pseudomonadota bacterium]